MSVDSPPALAGEKRDVRRAGKLAMGGSALWLSFTVVTGVILSRALGPSGKGVFTAFTTTPLVLAWFFQLGSADAIAYYLALDPTRTRSTIAGWLRVMVVALLVGAGLTALIAPVVVGAQPEHWVRLAWICGGFIPIFGLWELGLGALLGRHRFGLVTGLRVANPLLLAIAYGAAYLIAGNLTIGSALIISASVNALLVLGIWIGILAQYRPGEADPGYTREMLRFGFRGQFASLGHALNARLDLFVIPAILTSRDVGYYSVATSITVVVLAGSNALTDFVVPLVRRRGADHEAVMRGALRVTVAVSVGLTVLLLATVPVAVHIVYGQRFQPAVRVLDILVPGACLYAIARVVLQGIYGSGRPLTATFCQLVGVVVFGIGFAAVVASGAGILAVAMASSCSYAAVFVAAFVARHRIAAERP